METRGRRVREVAVVTGAAGAIGSAIASRLVRDGYAVACVDCAADRVQALSERLGASIALSCDVTRSEDVERMKEAVSSQLGAATLLVNAAGIFTMGSTPDLTEQDWDRTIDVNLKGMFLTCKAFLTAMIESGRGVIVNVASMSGLHGDRDRAAYCASKGGVVLFTRALARDHGPQGIRVNAVSPGIIDSPMASWIAKDEVALNNWLAKLPAGRLGRPDDVASAVAFLASADADYIHGETLVVDGGGNA